MNLGCHISIAKGFSQAYKTANAITAKTFQFFTRNPRGSRAKKHSLKDIAECQELKSKHEIKPLVAHLPYTVNAASPTEKTWNFACQVILEDLLRMDKLGVEYVVMHPGSFAKSSLTEGLLRIVNALEYVFDQYQGKAILCLETMAGKGTEIGRNFWELSSIINTLGNPAQLGVCLDSCHLFASGYDLNKQYEINRLTTDIENTIGFNRVYLSHLNDSKMPCGSNKDKHEKIGKGEIGLSGIFNYLSCKQIYNLPLILETPVEHELDYKNEISLILSTVNK